MANRSLKVSLLVFAALGVACGADESFKPKGFKPEPRVLTRLLVTPAVYTLSTAAPGDTLRLKISAYDDVGAPMPGTGAATYTSSDPAIAAVSSSGLVTAAAPGTAKITAALTLGGVTLTTSMTVWVHTLDYSDVTGVYDLTALVTNSDPAWGNMDGYRYTAVLTMEEWDPTWLRGKYADLKYIGPGFDAVAVNDTGSVSASRGFAGQLVVELVGNRQRVGLYLIVAKLAPGFIEGTFGCCGHISGTFKATRRQPTK